MLDEQCAVATGTTLGAVARQDPGRMPARPGALAPPKQQKQLRRRRRPRREPERPRCGGGIRVVLGRRGRRRRQAVHRDRTHGSHRAGSPRVRAKRSTPQRRGASVEALSYRAPRRQSSRSGARRRAARTPRPPRQRAAWPRRRRPPRARTQSALGSPRGAPARATTGRRPSGAASVASARATLSSLAIAVGVRRFSSPSSGTSSHMEVPSAPAPSLDEAKAAAASASAAASSAAAGASEEVFNAMHDLGLEAPVPAALGDAQGRAGALAGEGRGPRPRPPEDERRDARDLFEAQGHDRDGDREELEGRAARRGGDEAGDGGVRSSRRCSST